MKAPRSPQQHLLTRREALRLATALGVTAALGPAVASHALGRGMLQIGSPSAEYARPEALVDVADLQQMMGDAATVLVGFMPPEEFEAAHIPGSMQINGPELEVINTSDASIESWHQSVRELLGSLGITEESTVVAYDNGTLFSARLWWILHYMGHENVHVLDGGLPAWQQAGNEVETGAFTAPGGPAYEGIPHTARLAQRDEVLAAIDQTARSRDFGIAMAVHPEMAVSILSEAPIVLDARTPEEYAEGHIPGAVNLNFPFNAAPEAPKFFKPADELHAMYDEIGATASRLVIPYCASGVRSAVTAFALHLLGYDDVALYTGSWLEWGEDPDTPKSQASAYPELHVGNR